jgi:hypothetical protein
MVIYGQYCTIYIVPTLQRWNTSVGVPASFYATLKH